MPTYEYACKKCGEHTEVVQSFTDPPLTRCPSCKGAVRKVFGNVGITFKGSGFYKNDSRKTPTSTSSSSAAKSDSGSSSSTESSGDSSSSKSETTKAEPAATKSDSGSTRAAAS